MYLLKASSLQSESPKPGLRHGSLPRNAAESDQLSQHSTDTVGINCSELENNCSPPTLILNQDLHLILQGISNEDDQNGKLNILFLHYD